MPYPQSRNDPASHPLAPSLDRCYICDAEEYDMRRTPDNLQTVCSSCSRQCSWCGDWMGAAPGDMHPQCQEEARWCQECGSELVGGPGAALEDRWCSKCRSRADRLADLRAERYSC